MSDLIMRDEALKAIVDERTHTLLQAWINIKNTVPSVDAVEVVRCKECKWGKPYSDKQLECDALGLGGLKFPDDFCSYGERKDKCNECWYWSEVHKRCENKCGCQFKPYGERSRR